MKINRQISGFSISEMMLVLLVLTIVLAASMPVLTKRTSQSSGTSGASASDLWKYASNGNHIYYGDTINSAVAIGTNIVVPTDRGRLTLNSFNQTQPQIIFKEANTTTGILISDSKYNIGLGYNVYVPSTNTGSYLSSTAIGYNANAKYYLSTAIGYYANTNYSNALAIGTFANATSENSTAIGANTTSSSASFSLGSFAYAFGAVSIGSATRSSMGVSLSPDVLSSSHSVGIGYLSNATDLYSVAIGYKANASRSYSSCTIIGTEIRGTNWNKETAIGHLANAYRTNTLAVLGGNAGFMNCIAIGPKTSAHGTYDSIAIGYNSQSESTPWADVVIGYNSNSPHTGTFTGEKSVIGFNAYAANAYSIAVGHNANTVNWRNSTAVGYNANTTAENQFILGDSNGKVNIPGALHVAANTFVLDGSGFWTTSDKRLKNIGEINTDGLDKLKKIKAYNYTFKKDKTKTPRVGVIAQDLKKIFPNAVSKENDGYLSIRQEDMFCAMINSIKQIDKIAQELTLKIKTLFATIQMIDDKITALIKVNQINSKRIKMLESDNKKMSTYIEEIEQLSNSK